MKIKILHLVAAVAKSGKYSGKSVDKLIEFIEQSYSKSTPQISDEEIKEMAKEKYPSLCLDYDLGGAFEKREGFIAGYKEGMRDQLRPKETGESEHYKWEEGKQICNYLEKECPINDTLAGSTCPMCVHNPNQTKIVYNTEK